MTRVVLVDAGRSAVRPAAGADGVSVAPVALAGEVINGLLRRTALERSELSHLYLADPRCVSTGSELASSGWAFDQPPLGLPTTVGMTSAVCLVRAIRAIERDPELVAVVAGTDPGTESTYPRRSAGLERAEQTALQVAERWGIPEEAIAAWAHASRQRAAECSAAGDFAAEIVTTSAGYATDGIAEHRLAASASQGHERTGGAVGTLLNAPVLTATPASGASAVILTSEAKALRLGLRFRAHLQSTGVTHESTGFGIAPPTAHAVRQLLGPCRLQVARLDQVEVGERYAVTPVAWLEETGISPYFVNPRGADIGLGHLPRSGHLRALVTMLHSLEATGGRAGAVVASGDTRSTAFVLSFRSARTRTFPAQLIGR